jgi:hypothetical protein
VKKAIRSREAHLLREAERHDTAEAYELYTLAKRPG